MLAGAFGSVVISAMFDGSESPPALNARTRYRYSVVAVTALSVNVVTLPATCPTAAKVKHAVPAQRSIRTPVSPATSFHRTVICIAAVAVAIRPAGVAGVVVASAVFE